MRPYETGSAIYGFCEEAQRQRDRIYPYLCMLPPRQGIPELVIRHGDARYLPDLLATHRKKVDLIITSPPYATALPYLDTDRLSLIILGLLPRKKQRHTERAMVGTREVSEKERVAAWAEYGSRQEELPSTVRSLIEKIARHNHGPEVGFRRRNLPSLLGPYFLDMLDTMRACREMMTSEGLGYFVVGRNSTVVNGTKVEIPTDEFLFAIGEVAGWKPLEMINMELLVSRDIFRKNRGSGETILSFGA